MKIKYQKFILYIPFVNFIIFFFWLQAIIKNNLGGIYFIKKCIKIIIYFILINLISDFLSELFNNYVIEHIIGWITIYLIVFMVAFQSLKAQVEIYSQK